MSTELVLALNEVRKHQHSYTINSDDEVLRKITEKLDQAKRLNMSGQLRPLKKQYADRVNRLKVMQFAGAIEALGLRLISAHHTAVIANNWYLKHHAGDGEVSHVYNGSKVNRWARKPLSKYNMYIPLEIMDRLPNGAGKDKSAYVFYDPFDDDPVFAVHLYDDWYAEVLRW